jgi:hypothetical protein
VAFTRDGEKTIARYSDYIPAKTTPYIEVREVDKSLAALVYDQNALLASLHELGIEAGSGIDVENNCVSIDISGENEAKFKSAMQDGKLAIPDKLKVDYLDGEAGSFETSMEEQNARKEKAIENALIALNTELADRASIGKAFDTAADMLPLI